MQQKHIEAAVLWYDMIVLMSEALRRYFLWISGYTFPRYTGLHSLAKFLDYRGFKTAEMSLEMSCGKAARGLHVQRKPRRLHSPLSPL